jgi:hypothetical protein
MNSLGRTSKITRYALLPSVCQNHVATGVLLVLGTNTTNSLDSNMKTTMETTRKPAVGSVFPVLLCGDFRSSLWVAVRPPPPGDQEIL